MDIPDSTLETSRNSLLAEMLFFHCGANLIRFLDPLAIGSETGITDIYPFHVGVRDKRNIDGKREYNLYYTDHLVKTQIYLVSSGTEYRWKPSDIKWYML